jgi:tRNA threonylcarbamoyladenosine biosynthesis protein TsaB
MSILKNRPKSSPDRFFDEVGVDRGRGVALGPSALRGGGLSLLIAAQMLLCLDSSCATARVAAIDVAVTVLFSASATADRLSGHVLPLCARALEAVGLRPAALTGIACGGGPGSFTGLRVGLAVAKGLALPTNVPLYLPSSLAALAVDLLPALGAERVAVPCLDAGKGEVYVAAFVADSERLVREVVPVARIAGASLGSWLAALGQPAVAGNGADRYRAEVGGARVDVAGPTAVSVGRLALLQRARGEAADLERAVPDYGRPPDITVKKKTGP